ncbi:MAG TPA: PilZ domain-containing protein [Acidimicrobiia bacterium]|nr:PilZ domain-containing protein [Acidimicrobiia bacterium]
MMAGARRTNDDFATGGVRSLAVSTVVRVESAQGEIWRAQVTYVSDRLVGLRGWTIVDGRFRERDTVTLLIGEGDRLISGKAQVLAASGSLMRIVRRDASEETERRLAPRLRVDIPAGVTVSTAASGLSRFETDVVDLSSSGCAVRAATHLPVGTPLTVDLELAGTDVRFAGIVVRTWMAGAEPHAGVQFDPMSPATTQLLNRFLVDQLRVDE